MEDGGVAEYMKKRGSTLGQERKVDERVVTVLV